MVKCVTEVTQRIDVDVQQQQQEITQNRKLDLCR